MSARKSDPKKHCRACGQQLRRKMIGKHLEDMAAFKRRLYCDRTCMARGMVKPTVSKGAYLWRARKYRKRVCEGEGCDATERLHVHHKDRNWRNNNPSNLKTLCPSCHLKLHWSEGDHAPKRRWVRAIGLDGLLGFCERIKSELSSEDAEEMREHIVNLWDRLSEEMAA